MTEACVVMTTAADESEANALAAGLVEQRYAACVQIVPMTSHYRWDGEVQRSAEHLLLIKTTAERYDDVEAFIRANHSYDVPECIRVPVTGGAATYLAWLAESTATV